jgi:hypothetical protein
MRLPQVPMTYSRDISECSPSLFECWQGTYEYSPGTYNVFARHYNGSERIPWLILRHRQHTLWALAHVGMLIPATLSR